KRRQHEAVADRLLLDIGVAENFSFEIDQRLSEIGRRDRSCVSLPNEDRHDLTGANIEQADSVGGYRVKNRMDLSRPIFGEVALRQRACVEAEGIRHSYSSRISIMPRLNSVPSGSRPSRIAISRSFLAPIGLAGRRMPSCFK